MYPVNTYVSHTVHFASLVSTQVFWIIDCTVQCTPLQYAGGKCHLVGTIKRNEGGLEVLVVARYNPRPTKWVMDNRWRCWEPGWGYKMMLIWCRLFVFYFRSKFSLWVDCSPGCASSSSTHLSHLFYLCLPAFFMNICSPRSFLPLIVMDNFV